MLISPNICITNQKNNYITNTCLNFKAKSLNKSTFNMLKNDMFILGTCIASYNNVKSIENAKKESHMNILKNDKAMEFLLKDITEIPYNQNEVLEIEDEVTNIPHLEYSYYDKKEQLRKIENYYKDGSVDVEIYDENENIVYLGSIKKFNLDSFFTCNKSFYDTKTGKVNHKEVYKFDNNFNLI